TAAIDLARRTADRAAPGGPAGSTLAAGSALQRHDPDLDAAVEATPLFGAVVGDREAVAEARDLEALALQALADQVGGHVLGALLGDALVHRLAADVVGMAADLDDGLVVLAQGAGHVVQRRIELRLELGTIEVERHPVGQVELDGVAFTVDLDAGTGGLATQLGFLPVLVRADGAAGQATHAGTDHRALATLGGVATAEQAGDRADAGADQGVVAGAVGVVGRAGLAGVGRAAGEHGAGEDG